MAVRTSSELIDLVKQRIAGDKSDEAISFMEDVADTLNDRDSRLAEDWKAKYETNDAEWRQRYLDRFSGKTETDDTPEFPDGGNGTEKEEAPKTFDDLFKIKE